MVAIGYAGLFGTGRASPLGLPGVGLIADIFNSGWNASNFAGDYDSVYQDDTVLVNSLNWNGRFYGNAFVGGFNPTGPFQLGYFVLLFESSSLPGRESVIWEWTDHVTLIRMIVAVGEGDMYIRTSMIIKNVNPYPLDDFYCEYFIQVILRRSNDLDTRFMTATPGNHALRDNQSLSYVKYQPLAPDGSDSHLNYTYVKADSPFSSLVYTVAKSNFSYHFGIGTVNPHARVNAVFNAGNIPVTYGISGGSLLWQLYGGIDVMNTAEYASRMLNRTAIGAIVFYYKSIMPQSVVQFDYIQITKDTYEAAALQSVSIPLLLQPMDGVSGTNALFAAMVTNYSILSCNFSIFAGGWHSLGVVSYDAGSMVTRCSLEADTTLYPDGTSHLFVSINTTGGVFTADRAVAIQNSGAAWCFDLAGNVSLTFDNREPTMLEVSPCSGGVSSVGTTVTFYREYYLNGEMNSSMMGTVSSSPYVISVSVSDIAVGSVVYVRAASSNGTQLYTAVVEGVVVAPPSAMPSYPVVKGSFCDGIQTSVGGNCTGGDISLAGVYV